MVTFKFFWSLFILNVAFLCNKEASSFSLPFLSSFYCLSVCLYLGCYYRLVDSFILFNALLSITIIILSDTEIAKVWTVWAPSSQLLHPFYMFPSIFYHFLAFWQSFCITVNLKQLWTLVSEQTLVNAARKNTGASPTIDVVWLDYYKVLGKEKPPKQPVIKARFFFFFQFDEFKKNFLLE